MRILPPPCEGLHPALPTLENSTLPWFPEHWFLRNTLLPGLSGVPFLVAGTVFRSPRLRAFGLRISAYGSIGGLAIGAARVPNSNQMMRVLLTTQDIEMPAAKLVDRVGHLDVDDYILLGWASGMLIASQVRRPWSVSGWRRWVGSAAIGAGVSISGVALRSALVISRDEPDSFRKRGLERMLSDFTVRKTLLAVEERKLRDLNGNMPPIPALGSTAALIPVGVDLDTSRSKIGFDMASWPNCSDMPHLTTKTPGTDEPLPSANTNYTWSSWSEPVKAIKELESYISNLQARRQKLALEAEQLWRWLAEKEADYYKVLSETVKESDNRLAARRYVEIVGNVHTRVWLAISTHDWMIADARKHMHQLKSMLKNEDRRVLWLPPKPAKESELRPEISLQFFSQIVQAVEARKLALESGLSQSERELRQGGNGLVMTLTSDPNGEVSPVMAQKDQLLKSLHEAVEAAKFDADVVRQVVEEAQKLGSRDQ